MGAISLTVCPCRSKRRPHSCAGIPFDSVPNYPNDSDELANRVAILAAVERWCPTFAKAAYRIWFIENKDPGRPEHLSDLLERLGKNTSEVISNANSQEIRDRYAHETEVARDLGIFGSPTFVYGSELFWGDDRLEDAIDWCKAH